MELKRKIAMVAATLAVAAGAGQFIQNGLGVQFGQGATAKAPAVAEMAPEPQEIVPLAAGMGPMPSLGAIQSQDVLPAPILPDTAFAPTAAPFMAPATATAEVATDGPADGKCDASLDAIAIDHAMLELTLIAPCHVSERVVVRHGGLTITAMTSESGALFAVIPGMEASGAVSVLFADGIAVETAAPLPDLAQYRRFAVQWMADDAFQLNAFENGAGFGQTGHVNAEHTQRPMANIPTKGGYLSVLGDRTSPMPMLAEVYTYPSNATETVDLTIEASVTKATCDRELLGEVLLSEAGEVTKTDLTMTTPTCDAVGDVLVLNNPLPDLKLAASN
jgi:hypothetical protein